MNQENTNSPLLSVIVPVYNGSQYIENTVSSIVSNNAEILDHIELIMVDDGSLDDSYHVLCQLKKQYSNVVVLKKENGGIASARNAGLQIAKGKYIAFVDQDDKLVKGYLKFLNLINDAGCDMLIANHLSGGTISKEIIADEICKGGQVVTLARHMLAYGLVPYHKERPKNPLNDYSSVWSCLFRRELIDRNGIRFGRFVDYEDDWKFVTECLVYAQNVFLCNDFFYDWTINPKSESHTPKYRPNLISKSLKMYEWIEEKLKETGLNDESIFRYHTAPNRARTISLNAFYNACLQDYKDYKNDMQELKKSGYLIDSNEILRVAKTKSQKFWLLLLRFRLFSLSYILYSHYRKK